jgi:hypothetical protein
MSHQITRKTKTLFSRCMCFGNRCSGGRSASFAKADSTRMQRVNPELFKRSWDYKVTPNLAIFPVIDSSAVYFVDMKINTRRSTSTSAARIWSSELGGEVAQIFCFRTRLFSLRRIRKSTEGGPAPKTFLRSISRGTGVTEWRIEIVSSR